MTRVTSVSLLLVLSLLLGCKSDQDLAKEALQQASAAPAPQAISLLNEATRLDPRLHPAWSLLAIRQLETGEHDAAKASIEKAILLADQVAYRTTLGDIELARGEHAGALAAYEEALSQGGEAAPLNSKIASVLIARGDAKLAEVEALEGSENAPRRAALQAEVLADYDRALSLDSSRTELHFRRGEILRSQARPALSAEQAEQATAAYRAAIEANVEPFASRMGIVELLIARPPSLRQAMLGNNEAPPEEAKISALLTEAEPLASTDEERARHAAAKAKMDERAQARAAAGTTLQREIARNAGILGTLRGMTGAFDSSTALGSDPMAAMGALMGNEIGENFGSGGLGLRGTGAGGGGTGEGTIGLGNLGTIGHGRGGGSGFGTGGSGRGRLAARGERPQTRLGRHVVNGPLAPEIVRRVMRRHLNELRFCYEQRLQNHPDLAGELKLKFTVAASGAVQTSQVLTHLAERGVGQCAARAVQRWTFPSQSTPTDVTYPITFTPGATTTGTMSTMTP